VRDFPNITEGAESGRNRLVLRAEMRRSAQHLPGRCCSRVSGANGAPSTGWLEQAASRYYDLIVRALADP
jgi:hypothetical protein